MHAEYKGNIIAIQSRILSLEKSLSYSSANNLSKKIDKRTKKLKLIDLFYIALLTFQIIV